MKKILKSMSLTLALLLILCTNVYAKEVKEKDYINDLKIEEVDKLNLMKGIITKEEFDKKYPKIKEIKEQELKNNPKINESIIQPYALTYKSLANSMDFFTDVYSYGGNQTWNTGSVMEKGCGAVTACNIAAYHAKYYGRSSLYPYSSYSKANFTNFQSFMFNSYVGGPSILSDMTYGVPAYASSKGYSYGYSSNSCWNSTSATYVQMVNLVKSSIDGNNPVALLIGPIFTSGYNDDLANHWVTITGYTESNPAVVTVSTWGTKREVNLYHLIRNRYFLDVASFYRK